MQWKLSSSLAAITFLLLSAGDLVLADISAPVCTATGFSWSYNSLNQSPCTVTAYMLSTCYGGSFEMNPLGVYTEYAGPSASEVLQAGPCWCNTVAYSLMSACSECQGGSAIAWSQYVEFCTSSGSSSFPNPVPAGTSVPHWALVAISGSAFWSSSTAQSVGDTPESMPGALIDTPAVVPTTSSHTVAPPPTTSHAPEPTTPLPTTTGNRGTNGAKQVASAGGHVWGITTMAVISGLVLTLIPRLV